MKRLTLGNLNHVLCNFLFQENIIDSLIRFFKTSKTTEVLKIIYSIIKFFVTFTNPFLIFPKHYMHHTNTRSKSFARIEQNNDFYKSQKSPPNNTLHTVRTDSYLRRSTLLSCQCTWSSVPAVSGSSSGSPEASRSGDV